MKWFLSALLIFALHAAIAEEPTPLVKEKPAADGKDSKDGKETEKKSGTLPPAPEPLSGETVPPPSPKPKFNPPKADPPTIDPNEPPAETVPLPAQKPVNSEAVKLNPGADKAPEDIASVRLITETLLVPPGTMAVFSIYGPETFLRGATASYVLKDDFGRELLRENIKVIEIPFAEGKPRQISIPVGTPLGRNHTLELILAGSDGREKQFSATFSVPQEQGWEHWIAMISSPPAKGDWAPLRAIGVRGCLQYRLNPARREALRKEQIPFYVENISRQLLSRYHTEKGLWEKTLSSASSVPGRTNPIREPSLCSNLFAQAFAAELKKHAEIYAKDPPLFYSLASEPSMTRMAAAMDFDFHPEAIAEFQRWLERDVYGTVGALNIAWGTPFKTWNDVMPMSTNDVRMRLKDGVLNFAPWADFREFQDYTFSKVLRDGSEFIRRHDPNAIVGITGAMGPFAFGGWDWSRLANSLDIVECYDIGSARALWRDLAPGKPALAFLNLPAGENSNSEIADLRRTIWSLALEGGPRGVLLWDEPAAVPAPDKLEARALLDSENKITPLAAALAPALKALDGPTGALLASSVRTHDGIAILYSPASVRVHWLLESDRLHGDRWLETWGADTAAERRESVQLRLRESWGKLLDDAGLSWRFVSSSQLDKKDILRADLGIKTLILPQTIALSDLEIETIKQFVAKGGRVIADAACGRFDEHGRVRAKPALDEIFGVDTSAEPFSAQPTNPLEVISVLPAMVEELRATGKSVDVINLAPVFSDRPKWLGTQQRGAEYRKSPVVAMSKAGLYLNLDLSNYLRWRLHPDKPRAQATRELIMTLGLQDRLDESVVDWKNTRLPHGTQLVWLRLPGSGAASKILALRRNPQTRLHELGTEAEGNWAFEKPEPFTLALRKPTHVLPVAGGKPAAQEATSKIEGTLDHDSPALFVLSSTAPKAPTLNAAKSAKLGELIEIKLSTDNAHPALYEIRLVAPDGTERTYHALCKTSKDGTLKHALRLALNEPTGNWTIFVRDLTQGSETKTSIEIGAIK